MNKLNQKQEKLLNINEVSGILNVHIETLRRWDNEGKLKAVRIGDRGHRKYKLSDIKKILDKEYANE